MISAAMEFARRWCAASSKHHATHDSVPARLPSSSDALVHHVVGDEEVCLKLCVRVCVCMCLHSQHLWGRDSGTRVSKDGSVDTHQLDAPSQECGMEVLCLVELGPLEDLDGVDDGHASVELAWSGRNEWNISSAVVVYVPMGEWAYLLACCTRGSVGRDTRAVREQRVGHDMGRQERGGSEGLGERSGQLTTSGLSGPLIHTLPDDHTHPVVPVSGILRHLALVEVLEELLLQQWKDILKPLPSRRLLGGGVDEGTRSVGEVELLSRHC